jgi:hypothetical protein
MHGVISKKKESRAQRHKCLVPYNRRKASYDFIEDVFAAGSDLYSFK